MSDGLDGFATGKKVNREQEIYTPHIIVDILNEIWPEGIALDPCSGPESIVGAKVKWQGTKMPSPTVANPDRTVWTGFGLVQPWLERTYVNPPFKDLKAWMKYAEQGKKETALLVPVRTSRKWWRQYAQGYHIAWLNPITFLGYAGTYPVPLVLLYKGDRLESFKQAVESRKLGEVMNLRVPTNLIPWSQD